jgi:flagellar assembly factor FliW
MEIQSKLFGNQTVDSETIISFPNGIPGFENNLNYKLFHQEGNNIIYWLQAVDDEELAFSVSHPSYFNINYQFTLTDEDEKTLEIESLDDLIILVILHADENAQAPERPTVKGSIKSPLIINSKSRIGLQKQLQNIEQSITLTETISEIELTEKTSA